MMIAAIRGQPRAVAWPEGNKLAVQRLKVSLLFCQCQAVIPELRSHHRPPQLQVAAASGKVNAPVSFSAPAV